MNSRVRKPGDPDFILSGGDWRGTCATRSSLLSPPIPETAGRVSLWRGAKTLLRSVPFTTRGTARKGTSSPLRGRRSVRGLHERVRTPTGTQRRLTPPPSWRGSEGLGEGVTPPPSPSWDSNVMTAKGGFRGPPSQTHTFSPRAFLHPLGLPLSRDPGLPPSAGRPGALLPGSRPLPTAPLTQHDGAEPPGQALGQVVHVELHRIEIRRLHRDPWRRRPRSPSGTRQRLGPSRTRRGRGVDGTGDRAPARPEGQGEAALGCLRPSTRHLQRLL